MEICLFYQIVYKQISSILMTRSKKHACPPLCSSFVSNSPGYMQLKDFENVPSSFIAQSKVIYKSTSIYGMVF